MGSVTPPQLFFDANQPTRASVHFASPLSDSPQSSQRRFLDELLLLLLLRAAGGSTDPPFFVLVAGDLLIAFFSFVGLRSADLPRVCDSFSFFSGTTKENSLFNKDTTNIACLYTLKLDTIRSSWNSLRISAPRVLRLDLPSGLGLGPRRSRAMSG